MSDEELLALLEATDQPDSRYPSVLQRAVLSVLIFGGLRRQETVDLRVSDVVVREGSILIRAGKGNKSRKIFVAPMCVEALRAWLAVRPADTLHDYLFSDNRARRLGQDGLRMMLERIKERAGLGGAANIKPHSIRHACATRLMRNGANLRDIQVFLGHTNIQTTVVYLHTDEEQLRSIAELTSLKYRRNTSQSAALVPVDVKKEAKRFNRIDLRRKEKD